MTDTVASFAGYVALTNPGDAVAAHTSYLAIVSAREEVTSHTVYLALIDPAAPGSGRRRQVTMGSF